MLKVIWNHFGKYRKYVYIGIIFVFIDIVLELLIPAYMAKIIDVGIAQQDLTYIYKTGGAMVLFGLFAAILGGANGFLTAKSTHGMSYNLRETLLTKVMGFSADNTDKFSSASLVTRLTSDVNMVQLATMMSLRLLVRGPLILIVGLQMAYKINAKLSIIFAISIPIIIIGLSLILKRVIPIFFVTQQKVDAVNQVVQENIGGQRVVKAFVRKNHEMEKFDVVNTDQVETALKGLTTMTMMMPLLLLVMNGSTVAALWFGGVDVGSTVGGMTIGELNSFITYIFRVLVTFMPISMVLMLVARSTASANRIKEVLDTENTIVDDQSSELVVNDGSIVYEHVGFSYANDATGETLKDINLSVASGEFIAIISSTGEGKTTLLNLLTRFYDVTTGTISIGGNNIKDYSLETLRDAIGLVQQKNLLFSGTIRENLLWGNEDATMEQVIHAAKLAQAHDFIMELPDQYETWIEQGGTNVSGGQRQRLCIARALIKEPKILVLDDSTSALDTATEAKIRSVFTEELKETTIVMVAQRISSVREADRIVVMNDGTISAIGTHEELLASNQIYQEINQSQNEEVA